MWNWLSFLKASLYAQGSWSYDDLYGERIPRGEVDITFGEFAICVGIIIGLILLCFGAYRLYRKVKKIYFALICIAFYVALAISTTLIIGKKMPGAEEIFVPYPFISCLFLGLFIIGFFVSPLIDDLLDALDKGWAGLDAQKKIPRHKVYNAIIKICRYIAINICGGILFVCCGMALLVFGFVFVAMSGLLLFLSILDFWTAIKFFPYLIGAIVIVWSAYRWYEKYSNQFKKLKQ